MRMTRAYLEGFVEGRCNTASVPKCPHSRQQEINDWNAGLERGLVVRHFQDETKSGRPAVDAEVLNVRRTRGERIYDT